MSLSTQYLDTTYLLPLWLILSLACESNPTPDVNGISIRQLEGEFPVEMNLPASWNNGVYDATVETDPSTGRVWMVYSGVERLNDYNLISTHLGYSDNGGASWNYSGIINRWEEVPSQNFPAEYSDASAAFWQHEVPSIVYDSGAPENERWRILWHRYLHVDDNIEGNDDRKITYGWIGTKAAPNPDGLLTAPEQKLFSAFGYHLTPEIAAYNNAFLGLPELKLDDVHPELDNTFAYTEPGMLSWDEDLYVSLVRPAIEDGTVVLIKFNHLTSNWEYVGTLLDGMDAKNLNANWFSFSASDIFLVSDKTYMLVSPVINNYDGTLLFEINLNTARVIRNEDGLPQILLAFEKTPGVIQTGVSTYDEGLTATGILIGDALFSPPQFRMYATGITLN